MATENILNVFIAAANATVHILRAIEPNLRLGAAIRSHVLAGKAIPRCRYWRTERANRCIHVASRKQIGDALVKYNEGGVVVNKT